MKKTQVCINVILESRSHDLRLETRLTTGRELRTTGRNCSRESCHPKTRFNIRAYKSCTSVTSPDACSPCALKNNAAYIDLYMRGFSLDKQRIY